jgi:signal transduction histidine kinase
MMPYRALIVSASLLLLAWGCLPYPALGDTSPSLLLTNATDVLALSDSEASLGIPVFVKGVVTVAETNWSGRFYVQDSSAGVFVENKEGWQPKVGDVVEISGITRAGGYTPCITKPHLTSVGTAPLPASRPVTIEQLMSGTEDGQRVEVSGVLRDAQFNGYRLIIEVVSGGYRFHAFLPAPRNTNLESLVGARVLLRGTPATEYNAPLRHIVRVTLYAPLAKDFIIEQPAPANAFDQPIIPLKAIAQYRKNRLPVNQVHVRGVVTFQRKGEDLFLQDASGGLQVKSKLDQSVIPGQVVEAVGFPAVENYLPVLEDAVFRKADESPKNLTPQPVSVGDLLEGLHHANYVSLNGVLVDRLARGIGRTADEPIIQTSLELQSSNLLFEAEKDTADENGFLTSIPIGSVVQVSGICVLESDEDGKIKSVRILLPTSHNVQILARPSWLTPQHLLASLAIVTGILLLAISWSVMVSKKNSALHSLVGEKEAAQNELQQAHDLLEWRVQERTKQLKIEMTARKESELQFRAVLTERTRLAQELHDTLEQTITGIALQLDRVANHFQKNPDNASHHLKLARSLTRQGQTEVRHSVWGLRRRAGEKFNLVNALGVSGQQLANNAEIQVEIETRGDAQPLSEIFEENLLRIGQEAITNAVKHSEAKKIKIELEFSPQKAVLQIKDDGKGFILEGCAGPDEGHFGLLGIRERAERMGGEASISSAPSAGTCIRVTIPLNSNGHQSPLAGVEKNEKGI